MEGSQRVPKVLGAPARRDARIQLVRVMRRLELECRTREQADDIADIVAELMPDPIAARFGMIELLLNAIEHGNLEIGGSLKAQLLREHRFDDELAARLASPPYSTRSVRIIVDVEYPVVDIEIHDDGPGFAWRRALAAELEVSDRPSGRGLAIISRTCFLGLQYRDPGNVAVIRATWPR
jgi:anti-sigma regulatory factor (Ser/Thr protein kinase)